MEQILKQAVGIDCAKSDFVACFGIMNQSYDCKLLATRTFKNTSSGFSSLIKWVNKQASDKSPLIFVMEATGVYHEKLACYLCDQQHDISVVLPQRAKSFSKTIKTRTVTDKEASKSLTIMGLEKKLDLWKKPDEVYLKVKQLTREREQVQKHLTKVKNQIHAEKAGAWPNEKSLKRLNLQKNLYQRQLKEIELDIEEIVDSNPNIAQKIEYATSIPGVGLITAATIIAETDGFNQIRNKKQLVSYAGYDVVEKQSGSSVRGKSHISHHGNRHIRKALYFPAFAGVRCNKKHKELYDRLFKKHNIRMKAAVAIQRKQLILIYTMVKNEQYFDAEKYLSNTNKKIEQSKKAALIELAQGRSLVLSL
jgi:transposase